MKTFEEFVQEAIHTSTLADAGKEMEKKAKAKEARAKKDPTAMNSGKKKFDAKQAFADAGVDLSK